MDSLPPKPTSHAFSANFYRASPRYSLNSARPFRASWRRSRSGKRGLRIGSTTGYTRALLDIVIREAAIRGYSPDASVTPDEVGAGRPKPFMCYRNAILLGVYPLWHCVKIGDTPSDVAEALNAGVWVAAVTATGNEVALSREEWEALPADVRSQREQEAAAHLTGAGAHYTAPSLADCGGILEEIDRRIAGGERPGS